MGECVGEKRVAPGRDGRHHTRIGTASASSLNINEPLGATHVDTGLTHSAQLPAAAWVGKGGVAWDGLVWCCVVWCGVMWCGVVRRGVVRRGVM